MSSRPASHRVPHGPTRVSSPIIWRRRTDDIFPEDDPAGVGLGLRGRVTAREGQGEARGETGRARAESTSNSGGRTERGGT